MSLHLSTKRLEQVSDVVRFVVYKGIRMTRKSVSAQDRFLMNPEIEVMQYPRQWPETNWKGKW